MRAMCLLKLKNAQKKKINYYKIFYLLKMGQNFFIALKKIAFKNNTTFDYYYYFHVNATLALTMTNDIIVVGNCYKLLQKPNVAATLKKKKKQMLYI